MQPVALAAMQDMVVISRIRTRDQMARTVCRDETPERFDGFARGHQQGVAQWAARPPCRGKRQRPEKMAWSYQAHIARSATAQMAGSG